jgi:hypothetical protein
MKPPLWSPEALVRGRASHLQFAINGAWENALVSPGTAELAACAVVATNYPQVMASSYAARRSPSQSEHDMRGEWPGQNPPCPPQ